MSRPRSLLPVAALVGLLLLSGCAGLFGGGSVPDEQLDEAPAGDDDYDWTAETDVHIVVTENARFRAVYRINRSAQDSVQLFRRDPFGGRSPIPVSALRYRYPNGTVVNGTEFDARGGGVEWVDGSIYTRIADESHTRLVRVETDGSAERVFEAQGRDRAMVGFDVADYGATAVTVLSEPESGTDLYAVDVTDLDAAAEPDSLRRLTSVNESLTDEFPMPEARRVEWESDGWTLDGVLYHGPDVDPDDGDHPLVVAIHGGPMSYDEPVFSFGHAALTSRGYLVFRPNYRGGTSRGREFTAELSGKWGTAEVDDIAAGVESLADRGWVDPDRVFGHGFSYGGIAQGFLVTQEPDLFTAAAPEHGIYDLRSAFGTDDTHVWLEAEFGLPWEDPEAYASSTAMLDAGNIETPLLVMAGGEDWRCPPSQSEQLYVAARKQGVDAELVVYPDEHHNIGDPDRAIHRLEKILGWYETHDPAIEAAD